MGRASTGAVLAAALLFSGCGECTRDADCDDGLFCTGRETCHAGSCVPGTPETCDDLIPCTEDSCDEEADLCVHDAEDRDGDGFFAPGCGGDDCDDGNPAVHVGAEEVCDGLDDDCDGVVDEDKDGDGHYDALFCPHGDDCDDEDPSIHPGAAEVCDGIDQNCADGIDDEEDTDGDGAVDETCPGGDDCDDEDPEVGPDAPERCNAADDDCDGEVDETFECVRGEESACITTCGTIGSVTCSSSCTLPSDPEDCVPPEETCNGEDDDCDGETDETFPCVPGLPADCTTTCGTVGVGLCREGCEPARPEHCDPPEETCNGEDDDCDGVADETFPCAEGEVGDCTTTCGTTGSGECGEGCVPAEGEDCVPPPEVCYDAIDNDCDLDIDCGDLDCVGTVYCG